MSNFTRRLAWAVAVLGAVVLALPSVALAGFTFTSIDGGKIDLDSFRGHPVLVVNTASLCGFAPQFRELQALSDEYAAKGLVVLAVPSNDFQQELSSAAEVKKYCQTTFDITLPMTDITHVTGPEAHPFYAWLAKEKGFTPGWNFNKVLLDQSGQVVDTWGSMIRPNSAALTRKIDGLLP